MKADHEIVALAIGIARYKGISGNRRRDLERANMDILRASVDNISVQPSAYLPVEYADLLVRLPKRERQVINMVILWGMSESAVASELALARPTVHVYVKRARAHLRAQLVA